MAVCIFMFGPAIGGSGNLYPGYSLLGPVRAWTHRSSSMEIDTTTVEPESIACSSFSLRLNVPCPTIRVIRHEQLPGAFDEGSERDRVIICFASLTWQRWLSPHLNFSSPLIISPTFSWQTLTKEALPATRLFCHGIEAFALKTNERATRHSRTHTAPGASSALQTQCRCHPLCTSRVHF